MGVRALRLFRNVVRSASIDFDIVVVTAALYRVCESTMSHSVRLLQFFITLVQVRWGIVCSADTMNECRIIVAAGKSTPPKGAGHSERHHRSPSASAAEKRTPVLPKMHYNVGIPVLQQAHMKEEVGRMQLIPPAEISAKIMTLLAEAKEKIVIVSPYNNIEKWTKLKNYLNRAIENHVSIEYFVRAGEKQKGIEDFPIEPIPVPNLHSKIYLNERQAIVASMNLVQYSDESSLDIGVYIDDPDEVKQLFEYVDRYVRPLRDAHGAYQAVKKPVKETVSPPDGTDGVPPISQEIASEPILMDYFSRSKHWELFSDAERVKGLSS